MQGGLLEIDTLKLELSISRYLTGSTINHEEVLGKQAQGLPFLSSVVGGGVVPDVVMVVQGRLGGLGTGPPIGCSSSEVYG